MNRLLAKVSNPTAVLIALVLLISVNGFLYFYYYRDSDRGPIVEEERILPRAEGASPGTPKKDAAPEVGRGGAVGSDRDEASPVREAGPHSTAAATAQYARYATASSTAAATATPTATATDAPTLQYRGRAR